MQLQFIINDKMTLTIEAKTLSGVMEQLSEAMEVFGENKCRKCGGADLRYIFRTDDDDNKYYEVQCTKCFAKLAFGQHRKTNTLFPKRMDNDEGKVTGTPKGKLPDGGWLKWNRDKQKAE
jgi:hypothetical protein